MPCRVDEVEATVDSVINNMASVESALILQITLELLVDISDDALETVCVVNGVPIARSVHYSEAHLNAPLLYFYAAHINLHCLLQVLCEGTGNEGKGKISNFQYVFSNFQYVFSICIFKFSICIFIQYVFPNFQYVFSNFHYVFSNFQYVAIRNKQINLLDVKLTYPALKRNKWKF